MTTELIDVELIEGSIAMINPSYVTSITTDATRATVYHIFVLGEHQPYAVTEKGRTSIINAMSYYYNEWCEIMKRNRSDR